MRESGYGTQSVPESVPTRSVGTIKLKPRLRRGFLGATVLAVLALAVGGYVEFQRQPQLPPPENFNLDPAHLAPEMVVIPAGRFTMGSPVGEASRSPDEGPQHEVVIAKPFAIGRYEVTFEEYDVYARDTGRVLPDDEGWGRGRRPVINVGWNDATAYAAWLARRTGKPYRLPSEAEWEYAARAGTTTARYWGEAIGRNQANCDGCGSAWDNKQTAPVGSFAANPFGLHDMLGNVWEWVEDCGHNDYTGAPADGTAWTSGDCGSRVLRGGSWNGDPDDVRAANRIWDVPGIRYSFLGFRLARTLN